LIRNLEEEVQEHPTRAFLTSSSYRKTCGPDPAPARTVDQIALNESRITAGAQRSLPSRYRLHSARASRGRASPSYSLTTTAD